MVYDNGMLIADNRNLFVCFLGELLLGGGGGGVDLCGGQKNWMSCSFYLSENP